MASEPQPLVIGYTNWRGEWSIRRVIPIGAPYWGSTDYHPEPQWLQNMQDLEKGAERVFALKDLGRRRIDSNFVMNIVRDVAELPDRTSPDGSMMLVTADELQAIIADNLTDCIVTPPQPDPSYPTCDGTGQERILLPNTMPDKVDCPCAATTDQDHG